MKPATATHVIYMLDWFKARLSLELFIETDDQKYYDNVARYIAKYSIDPYEAGFDGELSPETYDALYHFSQMAETTVAFREDWAKIPPSELIKWLEKLAEDCKQNKFYIPNKNVVVMDFEDGSEWVLIGGSGKNLYRHRFAIDKEDEDAEAASLVDCAKTSSPNSLVLSLRQPGPAGTKKTRLRVDISYPGIGLSERGLWALQRHTARSDEQSKQWLIDRERGINELLFTLNTKPGIARQIRGRRNSAPKPSLYKYIIPLLTARAVNKTPTLICQIAYSTYRRDYNFQLSDLDTKTLRKAKRSKPVLFSERKFLDLTTEMGITSKYDQAAIERIRNRIVPPIDEVISAIAAPRMNKEIRKDALRVAKRRFRSGVKYKKKELTEAIKQLMWRSKDQSLIWDCLIAISGLKDMPKIAAEFMKDRIEWIVDGGDTRFSEVIPKTQTLVGISKYTEETLAYYASDSVKGLKAWHRVRELRADAEEAGRREKERIDLDPRDGARRPSLPRGQVHRARDARARPGSLGAEEAWRLSGRYKEELPEYIKAKEFEESLPDRYRWSPSVAIFCALKYITQKSVTSYYEQRGHGHRDDRAVRLKELNTSRIFERSFMKVVSALGELKDRRQMTIFQEAIEKTVGGGGWGRPSRSIEVNRLSSTILLPSARFLNYLIKSLSEGSSVAVFAMACLATCSLKLEIRDRYHREQPGRSESLAKRYARLPGQVYNKISQLWLSRQSQEGDRKLEWANTLSCVVDYRDQTAYHRGQL